VLAAAPVAVRLGFNEPVAPLVLRWLLADGRDLPGEAVAENAGAGLEVAVPADPGEGTHLLVWRVASVDGHAIGGSLGFTVGAAPGAAAAPEARATAWPAVAARFLLTAALAFGVGGLVFARLVDTGGGAPAWTRRLAFGVALAVLPAALLAVATQGLDLLAAPWTALLGTGPWAAVLQGRGGAAAGLAVAAGLIALVPGRPAAVAAWAAAALSFAVAGHAATAAPVALTAPAMALHALAVVYWLGALPPLAAAAAAGGPGTAVLLRRFSAGAVLIVAVLVLSGAALAVVQVRRPEALLDTAYGRLLSAKLSLVAVMLLLAGWNRWRLTPALAAGAAGAGRRLARAATAEILLGVAVLALVAGFRVTPPPRALAQTVAETVATAGLEGPGGRADLTLRPGRVGTNAVEVVLGDGLAGREVRLAFAMPEEGIEPIVVAAEAGADGTWRAGPLPLPLPGRWQVTARVLVSDYVSVAIDGRVTLPP
jgi:copper transport protein